MFIGIVGYTELYTVLLVVRNNRISERQPVLGGLAGPYRNGANRFFEGNTRYYGL